MTFDVLKYKDSLEKGHIIEYDNGIYKEKYFTLGFEYNFVQIDETKRIKKFIDYYLNGKIKLSYFEYMDGYVPIGQEVHYNEKGDIVETINHRKGYSICWAEAINIVKNVKKQDIEKYKIETFKLRPFINKKTKEPMWTVTFMNGNEEYQEKKTKIYVVNGITGKLIRTYKITMEHY